MHSEQIGELAAALAKAQGQMRGADKDKSNPAFHFSYATLASLWDACRGPLSANGLAISQITVRDEKGLTLVTMLMHASGQWIASEYPVKPVKDDPQGMGSAMTYARRYSLSAIIGMQGDDDDDGNKASGLETETTQRSRPTQPQPASAQSTPQAQATPVAKTNGHTMPPKAAIKTVKFGARMKGLNDKLVSAGIMKYTLKDGGIDFDHAQMSAYAEHFEAITDENIDAVMAALERRATVKAVA